MPRVFAISDLHVDFPEYLRYMLSLCDHDYVDDTLISAGDLSDSLSRFEMLLVGWEAFCPPKLLWWDGVLLEP